MLEEAPRHECRTRCGTPRGSAVSPTDNKIRIVTLRPSCTSLRGARSVRVSSCREIKAPATTEALRTWARRQRLDALAVEHDCDPSADCACLSLSSSLFLSRQSLPLPQSRKCARTLQRRRFTFHPQRWNRSKAPRRPCQSESPRRGTRLWLGRERRAVPRPAQLTGAGLRILVLEAGAPVTWPRRLWFLLFQRSQAALSPFRLAAAERPKRPPDLLGHQSRLLRRRRRQPLHDARRYAVSVDTHRGGSVAVRLSGTR